MLPGRERRAFLVLLTDPKDFKGLKEALMEDGHLEIVFSVMKTQIVDGGRRYVDWFVEMQSQEFWL